MSWFIYLDASALGENKREKRYAKDNVYDCIGRNRALMIRGDAATRVCHRH